MKEKVRAHAEANGYRITIRSSGDNKIRFCCHRSGTKPSQDSSSQKTDCPFAVNAYEIQASNTPSELQARVTNNSLPPAGTWKIYYKHVGHNHGPIGSQTQSDSKIESQTVINQRSTLISNKLSQLSAVDRTEALAQIKQVLEQFKPLPTSGSQLQLQSAPIVLQEPPKDTNPSPMPTVAKKKRKKTKKKATDLPARTSIPPPPGNFSENDTVAPRGNYSTDGDGVANSPRLPPIPPNYALLKPRRESQAFDADPNKGLVDYDLDTMPSPIPITVAPAPSRKRKKTSTEAIPNKGTSIRRSTRQNPLPAPALPGIRRSARSTRPGATKDNRVPHWLHEYVQRISDPVPDGHCGFRAIAISLGRSEDEWLSVREELIAELQTKSDFYNNYFKERKRGDGDVADHITALQTQRHEVLDTPALWLDSARMSYIIATTYKRVFCVYTDSYTHAALPLDCPANNTPPIFVCFDPNGKHFLSVSLSSPSNTFPIPEPWPEWHTLSLSVAQDWYNMLTPHFTLFKSCIIPILVVKYPLLYSRTPVHLDLLESD
ncbi:uncharacterized protein MELLADRAFT_87521 [Melampsora larici-populina 98AG31]|uniref:OTU domain-containing protein n=1 Tax=Melampsora larici-populina (strain 98AG31 / pathotype 3-4-7) TaxID=747676 RepID=F4RNM5_MELLP|nr:uncharacterized protein MELLADRAFT_87521 [Melampsora larici-populina 98AG31]EGG06064.1 hypothetical protein MELLADRAFT_87521 [Melampsora larici-populina 98AG31]